MEAKTVIKLHIYFLVLNTFGRCEDNEIVAISGDRQRLIDFYNSQLLEERFRGDDGFCYSFKEGPLHFYNPCDILSIDYYGNGIHDEWIDEDDYYIIKNRYFNVDD